MRTGMTRTTELHDGRFAKRMVDAAKRKITSIFSSKEHKHTTRKVIDIYLVVPFTCGSISVLRM
jgi:hypothetical protein